MAARKTGGDAQPPEGAPATVSEFDAGSGSARSIILAIGEMKADVRNLVAAVNKLDGTVETLKGKVDFARGAVWMLGLGMLALGAVFWMAFDAHVKEIVSKAVERVGSATPPTPPSITIQLPESAMPHPAAPAKPSK
jgi:hypothetical protein